MPKADGCWIQVRQIAFVIGHKSKPAEALDDFGAAARSISSKPGHEHNAVCTAREHFDQALVILSSRRIKPHCNFKCGRCWFVAALSKEIISRAGYRFSFGFGKLRLNFAGITANDQKTALLEFSRHNAREIGITRSGRGRRHGDIILVEASY